MHVPDVSHLVYTERRPTRLGGVEHGIRTLPSRTGCLFYTAVYKDSRYGSRLLRERTSLKSERRRGEQEQAHDPQGL